MIPGRIQPGSGGARSRVLVVDDDPAVLATTEAILSDAYEVVTAPSAEEALARLAEARFDAVCADYAMNSRMTGTDLLRLVGEQPGFVARVLVTGQHDFDGSVAQCYVLLKPYAPQRLLDLLERAIAQSMVRRRVASATNQAQRAASWVGPPAPRRADASTPEQGPVGTGSPNGPAGRRS